MKIEREIYGKKNHRLYSYVLPACVHREFSEFGHIAGVGSTDEDAKDAFISNISWCVKNGKTKPAITSQIKKWLVDKSEKNLQKPVYYR